MGLKHDRYSAATYFMVDGECDIDCLIRVDRFIADLKRLLNMDLFSLRLFDVDRPSNFSNLEAEPDSRRQYKK